MKLLLLAALLLFGACDKSDAPAESADAKLMGERLIAAHGEGVLASPVLVVYDSGFIAGSGSHDSDFSANVSKLGVRPASRFAAGTSPVHVRDYYSEEGVEFAVSEPDRVVVVDSTSTLTIRLLLGQPGIKGLRACEAVTIDRVCKVKGELRARLDDIPAREVTVIDDGSVVAKGELQRGWAVFGQARELSDNAVLEVLLEDGVRCNLSKWLVDPRDSCAM